jgi:hypothetical protein
MHWNLVVAADFCKSERPMVDPPDPCALAERVAAAAQTLRPRPNPAATAIRDAVPLDEKTTLRYVRLADLVALKLYAGARRDLADVVELLVPKPGRRSR